ncbi:MAG: hypothetical protein U0353_18210 [Sandaracinus sp.]
MRPTLLLASSLVFFLLEGCTCEGCGPEFWWSGRLPTSLAFPQVRAITVRACVNDLCVDAALPPSASEPRVGQMESLRITAPQDGVGASVWLRRLRDDLYEVSVMIHVAGASNGDRYRIEVADAGGDIVAGLSETAVTYSTYNVNVPGPLGECRTSRLGDFEDAGP